MSADDLSEVAYSRAYWMRIDPALDTYKFHELTALTEHVSTLMALPMNRLSNIHDQFLESVTVEVVPGLPLGDFMGGPSSSIVITDRVRDALPDLVRLHSTFTPCVDTGGNSVGASIWWCNAFARLKVESDIRGKGYQWGDLASCANMPCIVRDGFYRSEWFSLAPEQNTFDLRTACAEKGWTGLKFERNLNLYYPEYEQTT